ncbi:MAG TPA: hypothetical protein PLE24_04310 [Chitinispirillaceae bacterium]|jgi:hypothetical protein|nr:hypothetical protein [Chitinispirillaceae bacterium]
MGDPFDLFETLLPVIFFVIWIIISIAASTKKKRPPVKSGPGPSYQRPGTPEKPVESEPRPVDQLKKTLETIFQEMGGLPPPDIPPPEYVEEKARPEKPVKKQVQERVERVERVERIRPSRAPEMEEEPDSSPIVSYNELRNAIIWSEILAAPISMRDE